MHLYICNEFGAGSESTSRPSSKVIDICIFQVLLPNS